MARYTGPVCKLCRRESMKLYLKGDKCFTKCTLDSRPNPPGTSGKPRRKPSDYAIRLREKQKLKRMAGILERQTRHYYQDAADMAGKTGENMLRLIEMRLDNVVRKMGLATSLRFARQLVNHGHVRVNGKSVTLPAYEVSAGDKIELNAEMKENFYVKLALESFTRRGSVIPNWISWDAGTVSAQVLRSPEASEFSYPISDNYIVEFYTRR